jgi:hypothetical protein
VAARRALDEAIEHADAALVEARATRVRLSLDEAAARALLAGQRTMARALATKVARADVTASGARLVLAALGGDPSSALGDGHAADEVAAPAAAFVALGVALLHTTTPGRAGAALRRLAHQPVVAGDERVVRPAVELAARGVLPAEELPPDGVVELAAMRGEALPEALVRSDAPRALDARHEYLALALSHPESARARVLGARLAGGDGSDAIIAAASTLMRLAGGGESAVAAARALLARDAGDPLLVATALRVAEKAGDREVARRAREALTALGAERRTVE